MPITLNCPRCRKPFRVRDESVGMRVKCPTCGAVLQVPANLASASMDSLRIDDPLGGPSVKTSGSFPVPGAELLAKSTAESFLDVPVAPSPSAGPPSLLGSQTQNLRRNNEGETERGRQAANTGPLPPIPNVRRALPTKTKSVADKKLETKESVEQVIEDASGWSQVRSGLRLIQLGLFLALLYPLVELGIAVYSGREYGMPPDKVMLAPPGLLAIKDLNLFRELPVLAWLGGGILFFIFAMLGLMKCLDIPDSARTKGVASGTLVLTVVCLGGFAVLSMPSLRSLHLIDASPFSREMTAAAGNAVVYVGLLMLAWFLILLALAGQALGTSKVLTDTALSALLVTLLVAAVKFADTYYPLTLASAKIGKEITMQNFVTDRAVQAIICVLISARLLSIAGIVRKAIRYWLEDNQERIGAAAA